MGVSKNIFNKRDLIFNRKRLRNKSTSAESALWNLLKNRQVNGRKFRRQYSCGNFIVDFCCPSEKIIIELDGDVHGDYYQIVKDTRRDDYLKNLGFNVIRFENKWVFQDPDFVLDEIKKSFRNTTPGSL
jgi:very-short-patch-repair endonuclease